MRMMITVQRGRCEKFRRFSLLGNAVKRVTLSHVMLQRNNSTFFLSPSLQNHVTRATFVSFLVVLHASSEAHPPPEKQRFRGH